MTTVMIHHLLLLPLLWMLLECLILTSGRVVEWTMGVVVVIHISSGSMLLHGSSTALHGIRHEVFGIVIYVVVVITI